LSLRIPPLVPPAVCRKTASMMLGGFFASEPQLSRLGPVSGECFHIRYLKKTHSIFSDRFVCRAVYAA